MSVESEAVGRIVQKLKITAALYCLNYTASNGTEALETGWLTYLLYIHFYKHASHFLQMFSCKTGVIYQQSGKSGLKSLVMVTAVPPVSYTELKSKSIFVNR